MVVVTVATVLITVMVAWSVIGTVRVVKSVTETVEVGVTVLGGH